MKRALEERFNRRVFTTVDTLKFLRTKYAACNPKTLDYDLHDLLSLRSVFNLYYDLKSNASQTDKKIGDWNLPITTDLLPISYGLNE